MPITSVDVVSLNDLAVFHLKFESAPDFYTTDSFDRQKDDFQFFVDADSPVANTVRFYRAAHGEGSNDGLTIVRGGEIHDGSGIVVRDIVHGYDTTHDPGSGGWGPSIDRVDFIQVGLDMIFAIPLGSLKDTDGRFYFSWMTLTYGLSTQEVLDGKSIVVPVRVPEPMPAALWGAGLLSFLLLRLIGRPTRPGTR
jgi:hypothetical protein